MRGSKSILPYHRYKKGQKTTSSKIATINSDTWNLTKDFTFSMLPSSTLESNLKTKYIIKNGNKRPKLKTLQKDLQKKIKLFDWQAVGVSKCKSFVLHLKKQSTPCVKFTNIFRAAFLYESVFWSFSLLTVWLCNFCLKEYWRKSFS